MDTCGLTRPFHSPLKEALFFQLNKKNLYTHNNILNSLFQYLFKNYGRSNSLKTLKAYD